MGTPWDRAAGGYLEEWVPRFVPYHTDLVRQLALSPGARVLVVTAGPGAEVLALARAVGPTGMVRATDTSPEMVALCKEQVARAGLSGVTCAVADASDVSGPEDWDAIVCAFGLWQIEPKPRAAAMQAWRQALAPRGKVGIVTWGPPEDDDPNEQLSQALRVVEPGYDVPSPRVLAEREAMAAMFDEAGLSLVRHTVVRHTMSFPSAERFVRAMREACTWRRRWEELGGARMEKVARAFYEWTGGPDVPLSFAPPATLAIAGIPGAELELEGRPSVKVPASTRSL
jgi:ubiquinone/menaquinone biosynthesis C-methylase UbiE